MSLQRASGKARRAFATQANGSSAARKSWHGPSRLRPGWTDHRSSPGGVQRGCYSTSPDTNKQQQDQDRETFISVLEAAATKRDAKTYLKTFASGNHDTRQKTAPRASATDISARTADQDGHAASSRQHTSRGVYRDALLDKVWLPHVAIVKFVDPKSWNNETLKGLARTLSQLHMLGLHSIVVIDSGSETATWAGWRRDISSQVDRIATAIETYSKPGARILEGVITVSPASIAETHSETHPMRQTLRVEFEDALQPALQSESTIIVPSVAYEEGTLRSVPVSADDVAYALTTALSGLQVPLSSDTHDASQLADGLERHAFVDRLIVLDSLGGIPRKDLPGAVRVFVNLEEELGGIKRELAEQHLDRPPEPENESESTAPTTDVGQQRYFGHLELARRALAILPPSASAVITTPREAANLGSHKSDGRLPTPKNFLGDVGTRKHQNPLIHNLLTDRPVYSSSIPHGRLKTGLDRAGDLSVAAAGTTLIKRGMPVTILPDPRKTPWQPPKPGWSGMRLTDMRIDLPRLIYLIEDSFGRKLDVQHYLERVQNTIAGVIIAGEYEGGAILTWERPPDLDEETAYRENRLVPYLDKFAVLKKSQGAGGVADIVFNAMVRDCFPAGVCWRSRKDNPVNRWYFERSLGIWKLPEVNWTMFWTTPDVAIGGQTAGDYEAVCRSVAPSWADRQKPPD